MVDVRDIDSLLARGRNGILLILDSTIWATAVASTAALRYMDYGMGSAMSPLVSAVAIAVVSQIFIGGLLGIYTSRYRIGSKDEGLALVATVIAASAMLQVANLLFFEQRLIPASVPIAGGALALIGIMGSRICWRLLHESAVRPADSRPALIFGAGDAGSKLIENMLSDPHSPYIPVGLLDDDPKKRNSRIRGVRVLGGRDCVEAVAAKTEAEVLIVAIPSGNTALFRSVAHSAKSAGLEVKVLPTISQILDSEHVGFRDLRDINITDLLGRQPVETDLEGIAHYLTDKRVLVTGAGGSIGSELCRQLARFAPAELMMLDRDESALHAVQLSLTGRALLDGRDVILADIRDAEVISEIFTHRRPEVVFHAAALKHLPMLEQYPEEAWKTNVVGTMNVLRAAADVDVDVFVNISTDKAADPCSILGYSKRIAERLTAGIAGQTRGRFVSVRFGNVLGSRGSVLTAFADQIAKGGPVTVTSPEVTRFFMMIPEACELVIQAAAVGRDGEALVLEMGEPVKILDVAEQLIELSGRSDVHIEITGLRDGEKLHEDLFAADEKPRRTSHPLVEAVAVPPLSAEALEPGTDWELTSNIRATD